MRLTTPLRTLIDVIAEGVIAPELQENPGPSTRRSGAVWSCVGNWKQRRSALGHDNGSTEF